MSDYIIADVWDVQFSDPHHTWYGDFRISPYTENCAAYGDGHAETHYHGFDESLPRPWWKGDYVLWQGYQYYPY